MTEKTIEEKVSNIMGKICLAGTTIGLGLTLTGSLTGNYELCSSGLGIEFGSAFGYGIGDIIIYQRKHKKITNHTHNETW